MKKLLTICTLISAFSVTHGQGLENVFVETYYVSDANDATDTDGGELAEGSVTYRVFVDLAEGWEIQAVFGNEDHELRFETSTLFFNNEDRGEITGDQIPANRLDENTVALDSWVSMGASSDEHWGIPKTDDPDGSIVGGANNDGGSEGIIGGLLVNEDASAGVPVTTQDGLIEGMVPGITVVGLDLSMFADENDGPVFSSFSGAWSVLEGAMGSAEENILVLAQMTTDGDFSFKLNIQLGGPNGEVEQYVSSTAVGEEIFYPSLCYPAPADVDGCTSPTACNYDAAATNDDGSCIEPVENCSECNETNDGLDIIDSDNDSICDAEELMGCTSDTACNFDAAATEDDGSCIEPVENCSLCNEEGNALELIDSDFDGICDAEEVTGCTSVENACNYNPDATDEEACIVPVPDCFACNVTNDGLILIDTDADGICNADEVTGCQSETACNYNPAATDDSGNCIEPVADCWACNETNDGLVIIDSDNDGTCDAEDNDLPGCMSETACNYDADATEDDDSCIEPVADCSECNETNDGLEIIDTDDDGICDAEEIGGCTDPAASNYDPEATDDDGSCDYNGPGSSCEGAIGLEDLIVEVYYVSDANDATDEDGGELVEGSTTYRIYADLADGYELQAVYGNEDHELRFETTTLFFNNEDRGEETGDQIPANRLDENTVALDSYVTLGAASDEHWGVLKSEDVDGSIVGGTNNDGGSAGIAGGLLVNADADAGIPLTTADGLLEGEVASVTVVGLDLGIFSDQNDGPLFSSNAGAYSVLEGVQAPTAENQVLIAQMTTDGEFSFCVNLQLGAPDGTVEQYVASNPIDDEIQCGLLCWPAMEQIPGCTSITACNYNPMANFDNSSCLEPEENCSECDGEELVLIDEDEDGVCNAEEIAGCTSETACNYDPEATDDDDSCIEPIENCQICNETNDGLVLVDSDEDGICDAEEIEGCTSSETACNYNPLATDEVDCLEPQENCSECDGEELVLIDSDGDGICDVDEIAGCTSETACNYDVTATNDDGTCLEPVENCWICNETNDDLIIADSDGDGTCDALENPGCLDPVACNYDPEASSEDGSCLIPIENCWLCNETNDALIIVDDDGDGIANCEEIVGCQDPLACNYNPDSTEPSSCIIPVDDCWECNETNDGLVFIDADEDGVCDAEEILGCTSADACNYDPDSTEDDGSCLIPIENCWECNETNDGLEFIDTDGDGVCDAEEVEGCMSESACNYDPDATDDSGDCIEPEENCWECNETNDGLDIIDTDGDGVCDAEEVFGCTDPDALNFDPDATEDDGSCYYTNVAEIDGLTYGLEVFPNPTSSFVNIQFESEASQKVSYKILDLTGRSVMAKELGNRSGEFMETIDLSNTARGIYLVQASFDEAVMTVRVIRQ